MNGASPSSPEETPLPPAPPPPKKKDLSKGCITTIVVAIIVIAFLGVAGSFGGGLVIKKARTLQAKAVMKGLEIAIKGYMTEYLKLPFTGLAAPPIDTSYTTTDPSGNALLDILLGTDPKNNPRHIHFWEPPNAKSSGSGYTTGIGLVDPWGKVSYRIILDYDKDGHITDPEGLLGAHQGRCAALLRRS